MRIRTTHLTLTACAAAVALASSACSVSFDPSDLDDPYVRPVAGPGVLAQSGSDRGGTESSGATVPTGTGTVRAVVVGHVLPESLLVDFHQATGFTLTQTLLGTDPGQIGLGDQNAQGVESGGQSGLDVSTGNLKQALAEADVVIGADQVDLSDAKSMLGSSQVIGRDDVCVMADQQWFLANKKPVPASLSEVAAAASDLVIPGSDTPAGRLFRQSIAQSEDTNWLDKVSQGGAITASDNGWSQFSGFVAVAPQSGADVASGNERPLIVSTQSLAIHVLTNTGAESAATPIASTCLKRELYVAASSNVQASDGVEALIAYLTSAPGQRALSEAGIAYPNNAEGIENPMTRFAAPVEQATQIEVK